MTKKAKKKAPAKKGAAKKVGLLARTAQQAEKRNALKGNDALALIARRIEQIEDAFYDIALALQLLERPEIYGALGAKSFAELVESRTAISRSVAFELLKIPTHFSREMAVHLGQTKAMALVGYVEATKQQDDAEELARTDAKIGGKPISKQSAKAIVRETKARRAADHPSPGAGRAHTVAHELEQRIESATRIDVRVSTLQRGGQWLARLEVPIEVAARLILTKHKSG